MHNATNGFTLNICKVVQKATPTIENGEDALGDEIMGGMGEGGNENGNGEMSLPGRRQSGFALQSAPQRKQSMAARV